MVVPEIQFGSICFCHWKIKFWNVKKIRTKLSHLRLSILCVHAIFREKSTFFVACKKDKKMSSTKLFLNTKFCLFTHDTKNFGFSWNDSVSTYNIKTYASIFYQILFWYFKMFLNQNLETGSMCFRVPKHHPRQFKVLRFYGINS
jgi:hypothetical protein